VSGRRRAAATSGLLAVLLGAVGAAPWVGSAPGAVRAVSTLALGAAVVVGLVAWGLLTSVGTDAAESRLDASVVSAIASAGFAGCGCGHEHDPDEMHVSAACRSGRTCTHGCAACRRT
jgi:hypothetical protein